MDSYEEEDVKGARGVSSGRPPGDVPQPRDQPESPPAPQPPSHPEPHPAPQPEVQPASALHSPPEQQPQIQPQIQDRLPHPGRHQFPPLPAPPPAPPPPPQVTTGGIAGLSLPYQVAAAVSLAIIGVLASAHLVMVFLHVAPSNTLTKQHGEAVEGWVYPEFEQNWKLFAPNPLQQNVSVQVRAEITVTDGSRESTDWIDLSAEDGEAIRGNLLPSHVQQNELRRSWDFYVNSHDNENRSSGLRGQLSESYIRRIVMLRLEARDLGGPVERIQLRSSTRSVKAPEWSDEKIDTRPVFRLLPWWTVTAADLPLGIRNGRTEAGE
ncbi:DUF5819 family protein [Streptomyces sp. NBC_01142]|uniref:DUF5819 family protein n=1 Tax=Streptomyces sp. NBC_01142 TaxID=2975865 RepID=UPI0022512609|nr:DUF5819 family protein [Streptomyces sp. NBC_01142]MCX4824443.1 DUF5819 family protein [Streptomyces sp. NBC_01142]